MQALIDSAVTMEIFRSTLYCTFFQTTGEAVSAAAVNQVKIKLPPVPDEESTPG